MLFSTINTFFVVARRLSATSQKSIQVHSSTVQSVDFRQRSTQGRLSCNSNKISDRNQDHMMSCVLTEATDSCPITSRAVCNRMLEYLPKCSPSRNAHLTCFFSLVADSLPHSCHRRLSYASERNQDLSDHTSPFSKIFSFHSISFIYVEFCYCVYCVQSLKPQRS